jgi:hypothetical protein
VTLNNDARTGASEYCTAKSFAPIRGEHFESSSPISTKSVKSESASKFGVRELILTILALLFATRRRQIARPRKSLQSRGVSDKRKLARAGGAGGQVA